MTHYIETMNNEIEIIKRRNQMESLELKSAIVKMKNLVEIFYNRFERTE